MHVVKAFIYELDLSYAPTYIFRSYSHSSAIADHMTQTGYRIKWDHILATGQSDIHSKIKETFSVDSRFKTSA